MNKRYYWQIFFYCRVSHFLLKFVVGFSSGSSVFLPPQKPTFQNSSLTWKVLTKSYPVDVPLKFHFIYFYCILSTLYVVVRCQKAVLNELELGDNIARNTALSENVFMMVVCIELRIPLFVVGKPGSSKSLAKTVVADNMEGDASRSNLFKTFKQVIVEKRAYIAVDNQSVESIFAFAWLSLYYATKISSSDWFIVRFTLLWGRKVSKLLQYIFTCKTSYKRLLLVDDQLS